MFVFSSDVHNVENKVVTPNHRHTHKHTHACTPTKTHSAFVVVRYFCYAGNVLHMQVQSRVQLHVVGNNCAQFIHFKQDINIGVTKGSFKCVSAGLGLMGLCSIPISLM